MPGREPLSSLVNFPALEAETERVIGLVRSIQEAIDNVGKANSMFKNAKGAADQKAATDGLIESNERLIQVQKQLDAEKQKSLTLETDLAKQVAIQREMNKQRATDMRAEAREAAGLNDAYRKLEIQYNNAQRAAKNLAATPGTPQAQIDAANKQAFALSEQLKKVDAAVGQHQRKVGDYVGAVSILEKALNEVKEKLVQFTEAGQGNAQEAERLRQEHELLTALVNQQTKGFTSVTMELRANERALVSLRAAGMEGTEAFEQLQAAVVKSTRQMNEFRKEQKLLESAAPNLAALTTVAKGLGGAYAFGAGASALFADGNEKVEKELQKLVAIMTILQGLNELHELAEKKGAIATLASTAATRLKNFIMTGSVTGKKADTKATEENTIAQATNIEATEAGTIAAEENIVALESEAAATEVVTVATTGASKAMALLRFALLATGIGALLVLLPLAAKAMDIFKDNTKKTAKEIEELQEAINKLNESILRLAELENSYLSDRISGMKEVLDAAEKEGKNYYEIFAIKKRIAEVDAQSKAQLLERMTGTKDEENAFRKMTDTVDDQHAKVEALRDGQNEMSRDYLRNYSKMSEVGRKDAQERMEAHEKVLKTAQEEYERNKKLLEDYNSAKANLENMDLEREKFTADEERELALATAKIRAEAIININDRILGDERSTQAKKIAAMKSSLLEQLTIIEAEKKVVEDREAKKQITPVQAETQLNELDAKRITEISKANEEIRKLNLEYYKRNRDANIEQHKLEIEDQIKSNDLLLQNEKLHFDQRFALISDSYLKRRVIAGAELMKELDNENLTGEERKAIIAKYDSDILALTVEFHKQQEEERKKAQNKELEDLKKFYAKKKAIIEGESADKTVKENEESGTANYEEQSRKKIEEAYKRSKLILQSQIEMDYALVNSTKEGTIERYQAEEKLAQDRIQLSNMVKSHEIAAAKERRDAIKKYSEEAAGIAIAAVDGQYQHEVNRIQDEINLNTKRYDKEKQDVAGSTLNAQQKAAQLIVISEQQKIREDQLQQQKRNQELKQARFDRDAQILKIVGNTLVDASAQGWITPEAIAIEIAGAAAVAELLAKPLPHFAAGTSNAPAGLAIWGELGTEAKIDRRGNIEFSPNRATPVRLEGGERIIPHDELNQLLYANMLQATASMVMPSRQDESANEIRRLQDIIREQGDRSERASRNQKAPRVTIKINPGWDAYIRKSVKE